MKSSAKNPLPSERYLALAHELAECADKLEDIKLRLGFLTEELKDNGDPDCFLSDVFRPLCGAISSCLNYSREYAEEEAKNKKDKQQ